MIKITLVQHDISWEDPEANLESFTAILSGMEERPDLVLLPELFSTGFTMKSLELAEPMDGPAVKWMAGIALEYGISLAGSLIIAEGGKYYNRLIWMQADGRFHHYDKRHLFRMSGEEKHYSPGNRPLSVELNGFRFRPLICYDLRFPVWSRNRQDYDVLIYLANWPAPRRDVWNTLLKARALENQAFTIGVNRIGKDGMGILYSGETQAYDAKGKQLAYMGPGKAGTISLDLSLEELNAFRRKFPVWKDADAFRID